MPPCWGVPKCPLCHRELIEDEESVLCPWCGWRPTMLSDEAPDGPSD